MWATARSRSVGRTARIEMSASPRARSTGARPDSSTPGRDGTPPPPPEPGRYPIATGGQAIRTTPSSAFLALRIEALAALTAASMASAAAKAADPSAVSEKSRPPRTISTAPKAFSAAARRRLTVELSMPRSWAAPATEPARPRASMMRKSFQSGSDTIGRLRPDLSTARSGRPSRFREGSGGRCCRGVETDHAAGPQVTGRAAVRRGLPGRARGPARRAGSARGRLRGRARARPGWRARRPRGRRRR